MAKGPSQKEQKLMEDILSFKYDPEGFVLYAFPWGVKGTPLEKFKGPRAWQTRELRKIREHMLMDLELKKIGFPPRVYYKSLSSGRGPGKSALLAMLNYWMSSCWWGGTGIVTANTETQLRTRTMGEVGKWHTMAVNAHWFEKSAMSLKPSKWFAQLLEEQRQISVEHYYVQGQTWSEENPDAFAGAHSTVAMMLAMDEASGIPDCIWDVSEGFFTDMTELRIWINISNPRRNTGRFYDCFHTDAEHWDTTSIDSREVEGVDAAVYQRIADKYGEDHDVTRVEVRGLFPRTGSNQFIDRTVIDDASLREVTEDSGEPLIMGVDPARYGDNVSIIRWRKGRDARSIPARKFKGANTMVLAEEVANAIEQTRPDAVFIDGGGVGGGVVDRLTQLGFRVIEVQNSWGTRHKGRFLNIRVDMWDDMRTWLRYGAIDDDSDLIQGLANQTYTVNERTGLLMLDKKEDMRVSPDDADALALTFAQPVARTDMGYFRRRLMARTANMDYDIFS